jgi:ZIP family zinc transporter
MNSSILTALWWGGLAASSFLIGYFLVARGLSNRIIGVSMGFGAGALLSAIAYELIPESAMGELDVAVGFGLGALTFFLGDWFIDHRGGGERKNIGGGEAGGSGAAIFIGTLLDNIPKSIILGMGLALGGSISLAFLAAVFISNLPRGWPGLLIWKRLAARTATFFGCGSF